MRCYPSWCWQSDGSLFVSRPRTTVPSLMGLTLCLFCSLLQSLVRHVIDCGVFTFLRVVSLEDLLVVMYSSGNHVAHISDLFFVFQVRRPGFTRNLIGPAYLSNNRNKGLVDPGDDRIWKHPTDAGAPNMTNLPRGFARISAYLLPPSEHTRSSSPRSTPTQTLSTRARVANRITGLHRSRDRSQTPDWIFIQVLHFLTKSASTSLGAVEVETSTVHHSRHSEVTSSWQKSE